MEISKFAKVLEFVQGLWASNDQSARMWRGDFKIVSISLRVLTKNVSIYHCLMWNLFVAVAAKNRGLDDVFRHVRPGDFDVIKSGASAYERPSEVLT